MRGNLNGTWNLSGTLVITWGTGALHAKQRLAVHLAADSFDFNDFAQNASSAVLCHKSQRERPTPPRPVRVPSGVREVAACTWSTQRCGTPGPRVNMPRLSPRGPPPAV